MENSEYETVKPAASIEEHRKNDITRTTAQTGHTGHILEPVKPEMTAIANNDDENPTEDYVESEEQYSTIKRSPHSKSNSLQSPDDTNSTSILQQNQLQKMVEKEHQSRNGVLDQRNACKFSGNYFYNFLTLNLFSKRYCQ